MTAPNNDAGGFNSTHEDEGMKRFTLLLLPVLACAIIGGYLLADEGPPTPGQRCGSQFGVANAGCLIGCVPLDGGGSRFYAGGRFYICVTGTVNDSCPEMKYRGVQCQYFEYPQSGCAPGNPVGTIPSPDVDNQNSCK